MRIDKYKKYKGAPLDTADRYFYSLTSNNAVENRNNMTEAELVLWDRIHDNRLGVHFRRQHVIGEYIVDFVCLKCWLVIEVDGDYHMEPQQMEWDRLRTQYLNSVGFKVIRFTNEEILKNIDDVETRIVKELVWKE